MRFRVLSERLLHIRQRFVEQGIDVAIECRKPEHSGKMGWRHFGYEATHFQRPMGEEYA